MTSFANEHLVIFKWCCSFILNRFQKFIISKVKCLAITVPFLAVVLAGGQKESPSGNCPLHEMPNTGSHVAALVRCFLIGGEYISLIKNCHIRRRNLCVKVKRHWVTEWNRELQRKNGWRGREKLIVRNREQLQLIVTPWVYTTLTEWTASHEVIVWVTTL